MKSIESILSTMQCLVLMLFLLCSSRHLHVSAMYKFIFQPRTVQATAPELILISGCTGSGKSTFMMELALNKGILKCISTDTVRQVMRSFTENPALTRSTYDGDGDPIEQWLECCDVINPSLENFAVDSMKRGYSLVIEGVHLIPNNDLINKWKAAGGVAIGLVLYIDDREDHRDLIFKRAEIMTEAGEKQLKSFDRIRSIQDEMVRLGLQNDWLTIKQEIKPDPIEKVNNILERRHRLKLQDGSSSLQQGKASVIDSKFYQQLLHNPSESSDDDITSG